MKWSLTLLLVILFISGSCVDASAGDRSRPFQQCLDACRWRRSSDALPWPLRLTRWSFSDDCAYTCMHEVTDAAIRKGDPVQQFYGKWPFWRWMGMQEPASVFFSLLNLWVHWRGSSRIRKTISDGHPLKGYLWLWSVVSMNAWVWSSVFHTRDTRRTEEMDYFSAALVFVVALSIIVSRFFFLGREQRRLFYIAWVSICVVIYVAHVSYLHFSIRFDYTYNIVFNLIIGLVHNALWLLYALPSSMTVIRRFPPLTTQRTYRPKCASKAALCVALTMLAMSFELLDFPPFGRVLDAHALWHAATIPIGAIWYDFLLEDATDDAWKPVKL